MFTPIPQNDAVWTLHFMETLVIILINKKCQIRNNFTDFLHTETLLNNQLQGPNRSIHKHHLEQSLIQDENATSKLSRWFWWEPSQDSWLNDFCGSSVIHGLKYLSKRKLSAVERYHKNQLSQNPSFCVHFVCLVPVCFHLSSIMLFVKTAFIF